MPKKKSSSSSSSTSSLKKPSQEVEKPATPQPKPVPKPGKLGKEIDDIFGGRKKKKLEPENKETKEEIAKRERKRKRKERERLNNNTPRTQPVKRVAENSQNRPRKRTEDGLLVFTEDELGINKANAGATPLCPFDCDCCF